MNKTNKIINGICLFIATASLAYAFLIKPSINPSNDVDTKTIEQIAQAKIIARNVDKRGIGHVIVEETNNILPKGVFLNPKTDNDKKFIDSLLNESQINKNLITSLMKINTITQAKNIKAVKVIDSLQKVSFEYKDKDVYLSYTPSSDTSNDGLFSYKVNTGLNIVQYTKRNWLGNNPKNFIDLSPTNRNSYIDNVQKLTIVPEVDNFDIKINGKIQYDSFNKDFNLGPSLRLRFGNTTLVGDYLYNTNFNKFGPKLGIEQQLIGF